jgi:hypothetical protein
VAAGEIHIGDIIQFEITIKDQDNIVVDLSSATTKQFLFQKPDGSLLTKSASFLTDGTDGTVVYRTSILDFDQVGKWRYQVYLIYSSNEQHTDITKFQVLPNLPLS